MAHHHDDLGVVFVPLAMLVGVLPIDWYWKSLIIWWLKPLLERPVLYVLSRAIFREIPTIGTTLRSMPALLRAQWIASLTWRRLSLTRSYDLPIILLEGLGAGDRSRRLQMLHRNQAGQAGWLTLIGTHLETALMAGLVLLIVELVPGEIAGLSTQGWQENELLWFLAYIVAVALVLPFYVAAGFALYLNRRIQLEGWDIELAFRRIVERQRGGGSFVAMVVAGLLFSMPPEPAIAEEATAAQAHVTAEQARSDIAAILDGDAITRVETIRIPRFMDEIELEQPDEVEEAVENWTSGMQWLARWVEGAGWVLLAVAALWLAFNYRRLLRRLSLRRPARKLAPESVPETLFGLDVRDRALPSDVPGEARQLWRAHDHRAAVGLLYRASLARLMIRHGALRFRDSDTEQDALALVRRQLPQPLTRYLTDLTRTWCDLAYAHRLPDDTRFNRLTTDWPQWFAEREKGESDDPLSPDAPETPKQQARKRP